MSIIKTTKFNLTILRDQGRQDFSIEFKPYYRTNIHLKNNINTFQKYVFLENILGSM